MRKILALLPNYNFICQKTAEPKGVDVILHSLEDNMVSLTDIRKAWLRKINPEKDILEINYIKRCNLVNKKKSY